MRERQKRAALAVPMLALGCALALVQRTTLDACAAPIQSALESAPAASSRDAAASADDDDFTVETERPASGVQVMGRPGRSPASEVGSPALAEPEKPLTPAQAALRGKSVVNIPTGDEPASPPTPEEEALLRYFAEEDQLLARANDEESTAGRSPSRAHAQNLARARAATPEDRALLHLSESDLGDTAQAEPKPASPRKSAVRAAHARRAKPSRTD